MKSFRSSNIFCYQPQGGSIRGIFLSITLSNMVNTGQLRSIKINQGNLRLIEVSKVSISVHQSIGSLVHQSIGPSVHQSISPSVSHTYVIFANFGLIKLSSGQIKIKLTLTGIDEVTDKRSL
jgi:hypothetical protein